ESPVKSREKSEEVHSPDSGVARRQGGRRGRPINRTESAQAVKLDQSPISFTLRDDTLSLETQSSHRRSKGSEMGGQRTPPSNRTQQGGNPRPEPVRGLAAETPMTTTETSSLKGEPAAPPKQRGGWRRGARLVVAVLGLYLLTAYLVMPAAWKGY